MLSMLHACTAAPAAAGRDWNNRPLPQVHPALVRAVGDLRAAAFAQAVVEAYVANGQQPVACRKHGPAAPDAPPSWTARLGMSRAEFDSVAARVAVRIRPGADDGARSRTGAPLVRYWRDGRRTWWQPDMDAWRALWRELEFDAPSAASPPANDIPSQEEEDDAACAASALPASCSGRSGPRLLCDLVDTAVAELLHGIRPAADAAPETADAPWAAGAAPETADDRWAAADPWAAGAAPETADAPWAAGAAPETADDRWAAADPWAAGAAPETADAPWAAADPWAAGAAPETADDRWAAADPVRDDPDQVDAWRAAADAWMSARLAWIGVVECWRPEDDAADAPPSVYAVTAEASRRYDQVRFAELFGDDVGVVAWRDVARAEQVAANAWSGIARVWRPRDDDWRLTTTDGAALDAALDAARDAWRAAERAPLDSSDAPRLWYDAAVVSRDAATIWWRAAQSAHGFGVPDGRDGMAWR